MHMIRKQSVDKYKQGKELFLNVAEILSRPASSRLRRDALREAEHRLAANDVVIDQHVLKMIANSAIESNTSSVIPHLINTAHKMNIRIDPSLYASLCDMLTASRHWRELQTVLDICYQTGIQLSSRVLNAQLRLHLHTEAYTALQLNEVERFFALKGNSLSRESYNILIEAHIANRDLQACRRVIIRMENAGYPVNEETCRAVLTRMAALGPNQELEGQVFASIGGISPSLEIGTLNQLIRLRSIARDDDAIREYVTFLRSHHTGGDGPSQPTSQLKIAPNTETIALLIEHFGRRRNIDGALAAFSLIPALQLSPSSEVIARMMTTYGRCDRLSEALGLAAALFSHTNPEKRLELHDLLIQLGWDGTVANEHVVGIPVNVFILNTLLAITLPERGLDAVSTILHIMSLTSISPDNETARRVLAFLDVTKSMNSTALSKLLYRLSQRARTSPAVQHINIIFHALLREEKKLLKGTGGWKGASTFLAMQRARLLQNSPPPATLERVRRNFSILDGETPAEEAENHTLRRNLQAVDKSARQDHARYSLRMFYHARVEKDATAVEDLFEEMLRNDLRPNAYHIAALIEAYCNTRQIERAKQMLFTASADGVRVNRVLYTLLIQAYGNEADPDMGREIYCRMLADRVVPDITSLEVLVRGYFMVQQYAEAKETLLEFWPTVLPFRSRPLPFVSLSEGLKILREMEWHAKRPPPTKGRFTGPFVKEMTKKWQRTVKKSKLREISPVISKLRQAIAAAEVVEGLISKKVEN